MYSVKSLWTKVIPGKFFLYDFQFQILLQEHFWLGLETEQIHLGKKSCHCEKQPKGNWEAG